MLNSDQMVVWGGLSILVALLLMICLLRTRNPIVADLLFDDESDFSSFSPWAELSDDEPLADELASDESSSFRWSTVLFP